MAQVKAAPTIGTKASVYADPARCKNRYNGTASQVPELLKCLYEPYLTPQQPWPEYALSEDVLMHFASRELKELIPEIEKCRRRVRGVCGPEMDPFIFAQEWTPLQNLNIKFNPSIARATITFNNGTSMLKITFIFAVEHGNWVISDIIGFNEFPDDDYGPISYYYALKHLE